jgi:hypothetical protein
VNATPLVRIPLVLTPVRPSECIQRVREPVTVGLPFPRGLLRDSRLAALSSPAGERLTLQATVLDRWSDGSIRWLLLDFQATTSGEGAPFYLDVLGGPAQEGSAPASPLLRESAPGAIAVTSGVVDFSIDARRSNAFTARCLDAAEDRRPFDVSLSVTDRDGRPCSVRTSSAEVELNGFLRGVVRLTGSVLDRRGHPLLETTARLHFFKDSPSVRCEVTLRNPRRAIHRDGYWDLGDRGSVFLRDAAMTVTSGHTRLRRFMHSPEIGLPLAPSETEVRIYQESSGGTRWNSSNHLNRRHEVPLRFQGYRACADGGEVTGLRATPVVLATGDAGCALGLAVEYFWQNFPKALEASAEGFVFRLFPHQHTDVHEMQGGEQKTHTFVVAFAEDTVSQPPLGWCRAPLVAATDPAWYLDTQVVPHLAPAAAIEKSAYGKLVAAAIEGDDSFEQKREIIDEYGWRNFGDVFADHESPGNPAQPFISHYNNQYDAVAGLLIQYFRSGDRRWWRTADELARHVVDIDVYHTTEDKAAYNGGLFWHTSHYTDADTCTHRSYPRASGNGGGGLSAEHSYATGMMWHYFLTGNVASRETSLSLARWIIDMDDGRLTIFRWLDRGYTGLASATASSGYHGPGRGPGHAIMTLLAGHQLSGDATLLAKAEQLIRRSIHPNDDLGARNLLDAERRWSYTVFLQTLGRYLDYKAERREFDVMYAYARASLLHYARWMVDHEYPYLDKPEILEFPTETWAAQDIRKSDVFSYAGMYGEASERERFQERAQFFFDYSTRTLEQMSTRSWTRPVVILLSSGLVREHAAAHATCPPAAEGDFDFGEPASFTPQKDRALRRAKIVGIVGGLIAAGTALLLIWPAL